MKLRAMSNSVHHYLDAATNLTAGCILLFLSGALYALGIFNEAVEQSAEVPAALDGVWSSSIPLMSLYSTFVMLFAGVALSEGSTKGENNNFCDSLSNTHKVRLLSSFGSFSFLMMGLAAVGVSRGSAFLLRTAVALQGIAFGVYDEFLFVWICAYVKNYLVALELMAAWMLTRPGLAVGVGQMSFGFGCIFFSSFFGYLVQQFRCSTAFLITTAVLATTSAGCVGLLKWPSGPDPDQENLNEIGLKEDCHLVIPWTKLPFLLPFWYYIATILVAQAGFAFIPYFFKIGLRFGKPTDVVVRFQIAFLFSTVARPFIGMLSDSLKWGHGFFVMVYKNVMIILLILQLTAFVCLVSFSSFLGVVVYSCIVLVVFAGAAVEASVLARDIFSPVNSSLVFGCGASIAMGIGEFGAGELMSVVDTTAALEGSGASRYHIYYVLSAALRVGGLLACFMLQKHAPPCHSSDISEVLSGQQNCSSLEEREMIFENPGALKKSYCSMP